jgi:hypothetical protein
MISIAPRALSPKPTASDSRMPTPDTRAPTLQPMIFAAEATTKTAKHSIASKFARKSTRSATDAKKTGAKTLVTNCWIV